MKSVLGILACLAGMATGVGVASASSAPGTGVYSAARDFKPVTSERFVEYYSETKSANAAEHGVAIRTPLYRDRPAAAEMVYQGPAGRYDLVLTAVAEEDGESTYRTFVDGRDLGERRNPSQAGKREVATHRWAAVDLEPGVRIRVVFAGHTNGKIPEGDGTAWSRGRWRALAIERSRP